MASFTLFKSLPKFGHFGAATSRTSTTSNPTLLLASNANAKFIHTNPPQDASEAKDAINSGANEGMMPGENMMQDKAYSTAEHVSQKTKEMARMDTVEETPKPSKEFVKANAKRVEKCMNTKNRS